MLLLIRTPSARDLVSRAVHPRRQAFEDDEGSRGQGEMKFHNDESCWHRTCLTGDLPDSLKFSSLNKMRSKAVSQLIIGDDIV